MYVFILTESAIFVSDHDVGKFTSIRWTGTYLFLPLARSAEILGQKSICILVSPWSCHTKLIHRYSRWLWSAILWHMSMVVWDWRPLTDLRTCLMFFEKNLASKQGQLFQSLHIQKSIDSITCVSHSISQCFMPYCPL